MNFSIDKDVLDLGMKVAIVVIKGMDNKRASQEFVWYRDSELNILKENLTPESILNDSILKGFWKMHERVGKTSKHDMSSPENLLNMLLKNGVLPSINLIVDIYNLVSV